MISKSTTFKIASMAILFSLAACSGQEEKSDAEQASAPASKIELPANLKFNNDKMNAMYPWYLELQEALVIEDLSAAKKAAFSIEEGSRQLGGSSELTNTAAAMVAARDIARQRELFQTITAELIAEVKNSGLKSGELFIAHCPMAFDNKGGDWLSSTEEIRNPYYGDEMLTCGSVKETI